MPAARSSRLRSIALGAVLVVALCLAYARAVRGDFLWDDDLHITANPTIVGPLGLKEIWTTARANYFPLVLTNFWVQHALWGLHPFGYHVVTLACHAFAAVLLWRVLLALRIPGPWLGAALWALHPVQVESVAWICELKNTQSAVFFLAAILFWIRWMEVAADVRRLEDRAPSLVTSAATRNRLLYCAALSCALLAILSKPSTVMLPIALALATWWQRRRFTPRDLVPLIPFFALSALAAGWTIWEQKYHSGAEGAEWSQTLSERMAIAGRVVWFYLGKLACPQPLIFIYPRWEIHGANPFAYVASILAALALFLLWRWRARPAARATLFSAAYFVALLFPVLGFFSVYFFRYSFVGDHFQYLASMGPLALAGAAITRYAGKFARGLGAVGLLSLGLLTSGLGRVYQSRETLWKDTLAKNPSAVMAWLNLADTYAQSKQYALAITTYRRALELRPTDPDGWNDLGNVLSLVGRPAEAVTHLERALALAPTNPDVHSNLGNALRALGRSREAVAHYRRALELKPDHVESLNNLGAELAETGAVEEALPYFQSALRANPKHASAHDNLGNALRRLGRFDEAIAEHQAAIRVQPDFIEAQVNLGRTLLAAGRKNEALAQFERILQAKPGSVAARSAYASALAAAGRSDDALAALQRGVELSPNAAEAHQNYGVALAQESRTDEAIGQFEAAVKLEPNFVMARVNLANALGARGRWSEAIPHLRAALETRSDQPAVHAQLAVSLVNTGQLEAAVPEFETALRQDPASAETHNNFAQLLRALGRNREALEQFERAAELQRGRR